MEDMRRSTKEEQRAQLKEEIECWWEELKIMGDIYKNAHDFIGELDKQMYLINANIPVPTYIRIAHQKSFYFNGLMFTKGKAKQKPSEVYLPTSVIAKVLVDYIASLKLEEAPDL